MRSRAHYCSRPAPRERMQTSLASATTATPPPLALLQRRWTCKQHRPLRAGRAPRRQHGCIMESLNAKAPETATCKKDEQRDLLAMIAAIKEKLKSMGDGEINISAYDTAWVALVKNLEGSDGPQFPLSIDWIAQNQLSDGSWGDNTFFLVHDRIINTLACIVALKSWNVHDDKCIKGLSFINKNLRRITEDDEDWMLIGFEITFPTLIQMAKDLSLDIPFDEPALQVIYTKRDQKLTKIPKDILHVAPTTLLLSIEGMPSLDWRDIFKFQCSDGSFMASPAPTAYALMHTGDKKCFKFIDVLVNKFNGGVPFNYPLDIFEPLWVVDRLERLGISRYFKNEIKEYLDYVYRHWTQEGLPATKDFPLKDIDDTAMGFRLLRLCGYHVSPCIGIPIDTGAFNHFEKDGEFLCYPGQSNQSVTAMYNLYRAAQVSFLGEAELERAHIYCGKLLAERRASGKFKDKWVIPKDLPGEVGYALDFPWKVSLPRVETRMYLDQYGGSADVWIGKVLYRMPLICNDLYLETARADFRIFQRLCRREWHGLRKWYDENNIGLHGVTPDSALRTYFLAAANILEPNRAAERLAWARTAVLAEAISRRHSHGSNELARGEEHPTERALLGELHYELNSLAPSNDAYRHLQETWVQWLRSWSCDSFEGNTALLLVRTIEICSGRHSSLTKQNVNHQEYCQLESLTHSICCKLASRVLAQVGEKMEKDGNLDQQVDLEMQELAQCVLQNCNSINWESRQTFLHVVKSYYYVAYCSPETISNHVSKVLFEDV